MMKKLTLPRPVYLKEPADYQKFQETLQSICERSLSHDWDWTFKVGGKVHRKLQTTDKDNLFFELLQKEEGIKNEKKQIDEEGKIKISPGISDAMGKTGWERQKLRQEEDRFYKGNLGVSRVKTFCVSEKKFGSGVFLVLKEKTRNCFVLIWSGKWTNGTSTT